MTIEKYKGILFLDMDGVLCTPRMMLTTEKHTHNFLDPVCVQILDRFCIDHQLTLVCSSAWRGGKDVPNILGTHGVSTFFATRYKISDLGHYLGRDDRFGYETCNTPRHTGKEDSSRGSEILHWLKDNSDLMEDPNRFIIFDDEVADIISHERLSSHVVKCDMYNGITWEAYHDATQVMKDLDSKPIIIQKPKCKFCDGHGKYMNVYHAGDMEPQGIVKCERCNGTGVV